MKQMLKLVCENCGSDKDVIPATGSSGDEFCWDDLCQKCYDERLYAQQMYLESEHRKDQKYFNSLSSEQKAELQSEYALAGVQDAGEWFGY